MCVPATAVAQLNIAFATQAKGWLYESQPLQTLVVSTSSENSTGTRFTLGTGVIVSRCDTLENPHCLMNIGAEQGSKCTLLHR